MPLGGVEQEVERPQAFARIGRVGHIAIDDRNVHTRLL
jgi:hypothetical protein